MKTTPPAASSDVASNPAAAPASTQAAPNEKQVILACLGKIRRRLYSVRLAERLALAVTAGAIVSLPLTGSRLLRDFNPHLGALTASLALFLAAILFYKARAWGTSLRLNQTILTVNLARAAAVLAAALAIAGIVLAYTTPNARLPLWAIPAATLGAFVLLALSTLRQVTMQTAAIFVDQRAGLQERVSTALEMLDQTPATPLEAAFRAPVIESALASCLSVNRAKVGYRKLDSRAYPLAAAVALAAVGVSFLTPLAPAARPVSRKFVQVQKNVETLAQAIRQMEEKKLPNDTVSAEKLKPLQQTLSALQQGKMSPIDTSSALEQAKAQMKQDQEAMQASDKVEEALKQMQATQEIAKAEEAMKQADLQHAAGNNQAGAQQQQAAKDAMDKAAKELADKMNGNNGGMNDQQKKDLADKLDAAAKGAGADKDLQKSLQQAADSVRRGDSQGVQDNMKSAADRMAQQQSDNQLSKDDLNRAMDEIDRAQRDSLGGGDNQQGMDQQANGGNNPGDQNNSDPNGGDQNSGPQPGGQQGGGNPQATAGGQDGSGAQPNGGGQPGGNPQGLTGDGSTPFEQRGSPGSHDNPDTIGRDKTMVKLYDPHDIQSNGQTERVGGNINPLGKAAGSVDVMTQGERSNSTIVPLDQALNTEKQRIMDDVNKQEIPPKMKEMIKVFYGG